MNRILTARSALALSFALGAGYAANAQQAAECRVRTTGPDVIVGELVDMEYDGHQSGIHAFAVGTISCNVGTANIAWQANNNLHPVIGQNMYRLKDGKFEQIGLSWLKHGFTALTQNLCATCSGQGGVVLGVGCSDPYVASLNGSQDRLGPRWQVNPATGVYVYPFSSPAYSGALPRRLQVADADLVPSQNAGARYFVEGQYVTQDDAAAGNNWNNVSYRAVTLTYNTQTSNVDYAWAGPTQCTRPAIMAWHDHGLGLNMPDPDVTVVSVDVPLDGRFWVACKVTANGDGTWHYEYAVQNITSDRCAGGIRFPLPIGAVATNLAFHSVPYHDGDGIPTNPAQPATTSRNFASTPWGMTASGNQVRFATDPFTTSDNANALRWGTLYNFRFDTNAQPGTGTATLELFKPGTTTEVSIPNIPVPSEQVPRNIRVTLDTLSVPDLISPNVAATIKATILPGDDTVQPGSTMLFYRFTNNAGDPFASTPMTPTANPNEYAGMIPPSNCGHVVAFYVQATGSNSGSVTSPLQGTLAPMVRPVGVTSIAFSDDFETDKNWSGASPTDTASPEGRWARVIPVGSSFNPGTLFQVQPATDHTPDPGVYCWVTGQAAPGAPITASDVDGGVTTLTSPTLDLSTALTAKINYWRWFVSGVSSQAHEDPFIVQISNDNGANWSALETVPGTEGVGGWVQRSIPVAIPLTSQMKVRFIAEDLGTEQVVEAAVDDFSVEVTSCTNNCRADWNHQNGVTLQDLFDFVGDYFRQNADFNGVDGTTIQDLFDFIDAWYHGC